MSHFLEEEVRQALHPEVAGKRLPKGCDQRGRYPEAADAATEVGADEGADKRFEMAARMVILVVFVGVTAAYLVSLGGALL